MTEIRREERKTGECCCEPVAPKAGYFRSGCMICGKPLDYELTLQKKRCVLCGQIFEASCACVDGHFVCDDCHRAGTEEYFLPLLLESSEKDPLQLLEKLMDLPQVHMHGPEHHALVPCVLLAAYRNNGGEIELESALREALRRAKQVPGGSCGYWGVCGAAAGAGIYLSILLGSNPLHKEAWPFPQRLTAECLNANAELGGPRCCKRTSRIAILKAAETTEELLGIPMPTGQAVCRYYPQNRECLYRNCPFFPKEGEASRQGHFK